MEIEKITENNLAVTHVTADEIVITDAHSAVDSMMTVKYETWLKNIAISKSDYRKVFVLSNGIAGEILQKFVNYQFRIAIYGDYTKYTNKLLKDFIYETTADAKFSLQTVCKQRSKNWRKPSNDKTVFGEYPLSTLD